MKKIFAILTVAVLMFSFAGCGNKKETKIPVIGMGGIAKAEDAIEMMMAGASAVQVGGAIFNNPYAPIEIIDGMNEFLDNRGIKSVKEIIGCIEPW